MGFTMIIAGLFTRALRYAYFMQRLCMAVKVVDACRGWRRSPEPWRVCGAKQAFSFPFVRQEMDAKQGHAIKKVMCKANR